MNLLQDTKRLLHDNDYEVYGRVTETGCSFYYPERREEPMMDKTHIDYTLIEDGVDVAIWSGNDIPVFQARHIIKCPKYARKPCIIMHLMHHTRVIHFSSGLIYFVVDDQVVDEVTFLAAMPDDGDEDLMTRTKEQYLKGILVKAYAAGMTDEYAILAAQHDVLDGFQIARQVFFGELQDE